METVRGVVELTRPMNAIVGGILTLIGAYVAGGLGVHPTAAIAAGLATVLAAGAGNTINDYFDREIDAINDPERPIPRGAVTPQQALWSSVILFCLAIVLALTLPLTAIAIATIDLLALVAYTKLFKGLPGVGNVVVAGLGGSTFLFGGAAVGSDILAPVAVLGLLAGLTTLTREIIKDVEDIEGDREEGLYTLPIAVGVRRALVIGTVVMGGAVALSPLVYLDGTFGVAYLLLVIPADCLLIGSALYSFRDPTTAQLTTKLGMFLAAGAFVAGRVVG